MARQHANEEQSQFQLLPQEGLAKMNNESSLAGSSIIEWRGGGGVG